MAKVTGLGGIFYKVADPAKTQAWYKDMLGIGGDWGANFRWADETGEDPFSLLSPFKESTDYLAPSTAPFMINLRVDDLDGLIAELEGKGIEILGRQDEDYGNFAWILDCDGIKLELWQQKGAAPDLARPAQPLARSTGMSEILPPDFITVWRNITAATRTKIATQRNCQSSATRCGQSVSDWTPSATIESGELKGKI
jgi:catechol 2,3-dioxygenase-like lactoylglutathione lyase family enzyme